MIAARDRGRELARLGLARVLEQRARWSRRPRGAAIVWHAVGPRAGDRRFELDPPLAVDRLEPVVAHLARRYRLTHASELPAAAAARRRGERLPVAITFDDDLPSHLRYAAPVLGRHGAVATIFLCGVPGPFWWQRLQAAADNGQLAGAPLPHVAPELVAAAAERRPRALHALAAAVEGLVPSERDDVASALARLAPDLPAGLDAAGADTLERAGWEIGAHTRRHDALPGVDVVELAPALASAREVHGRTVGALAYPHGKAGAREAAAARAAGYRVAYSGRAEIVDAGSDPHLLGRLQPSTRSPGRFALSLARSLAA